MIENSLPQQHKSTPETASVVDAIIGEVELLFERKEDVLAQLTLGTATWGLAWWEEKFGLLTDLAKPYDHRRSCIRAKMRGAGTTTVAMLQNMAESFTNGEVEIVELTRQYKIIFRFVGSQGIPPNIEDLGASIREAIPAHIEYGFSYTYVTHEELAGLTHEQMQQMTHEQIRISDAGDEAKASVTDTFAIVEKTSGYSLPLPLKTDNYNIAIVNEVTQLVDAALVGHQDQISPSVSKEAPADADWIVLADSTDRFKRVKLLWSKVVDFMKTVFYTKEESDAQNAEKANANNAVLTGTATLNGKEIPTTESGYCDLALLGDNNSGAWVKAESNSCRYVINGNTVYVYGKIAGTLTGVMGGYIKVTGLPVPMAGWKVGTSMTVASKNAAAEVVFSVKATNWGNRLMLYKSSGAIVEQSDLNGQIAIEFNLIYEGVI